MKSLKQQRIDQLVIGFALFPCPSEPEISFSRRIWGWGPATCGSWGFCYYMADIGIAILAIFALIRNGGEISAITTRTAKSPVRSCCLLSSLHRPPSSPPSANRGSVQEMFTEPVFGDVSCYGLPAGSSFCWSCFFDHQEILCRRYHRQDPDSRSVLGLLTRSLPGVISPLGEIADDHMMDNVVVAGINSVTRQWMSRRR